jgi:hypothetical protein
MYIKTKFSIGDSVYLMNFNKIDIKQVERIDVVVFPEVQGLPEEHVDIFYRLEGDDTKYDESVLYRTKTELLRSL